MFDLIRPTNAIERRYAEIAVIAQWRQERLTHIETKSLNHEARNLSNADSGADPDAPPHIGSYTNNADRIARAFGQLANHSRILDLLHRHDMRSERQYTRAIRQIEHLRGQPLFPQTPEKSILPSKPTEALTQTPSVACNTTFSPTNGPFQSEFDNTLPEAVKSNQDNSGPGSVSPSQPCSN